MAITQISAAVVFGRGIIEVIIVGSGVAAEGLPPLVAMRALAGIIAVAAYRLALKSEPSSSGDTPPSELKGAVMFGLIYIVVLFAVSFAKQHFGYDRRSGASQAESLIDEPVFVQIAMIDGRR